MSDCKKPDYLTDPALATIEMQRRKEELIQKINEAHNKEEVIDNLRKENASLTQRTAELEEALEEMTVQLKAIDDSDFTDRDYNRYLKAMHIAQAALSATGEDEDEDV